MTAQSIVLNVEPNWIGVGMSDLISREDAINAMMLLKRADDLAYGCEIPESFDSERAIEALKNSVNFGWEMIIGIESIPNPFIHICLIKNKRKSENSWCKDWKEKTTDTLKKG